MKAIKFLLLPIVVLTISTIFCACEDDKMKPITLRQMEDTTIKLAYQNIYPIGYTIQGGDGNYSVICDNPEIVSPKIVPLTDVSASDLNLSLEVKGIGTTKVTITDNSQNSLVLNIIVNYLSLSFTVTKHEIFISGDELTENEKKAISEEYLTEIPVKIGGGYKFTFTDLSQSEGEAVIYADKFGNNAIKTTFEKLLFDNYSTYEIIVNDVKRSFIFSKYISPAKSEAYVPLAFWEDITSLVQAKYPKAEQVVTEQAIEIFSN